VEEIGLRTRRWHTYRSDEGLVVEFEAEMTVPQERDLVTRLGALKVRSEARLVAPITAL
jgi:hypothetical protein